MTDLAQEAGRLQSVEAEKGRPRIRFGVSSNRLSQRSGAAGMCALTNPERRSHVVPRLRRPIAAALLVALVITGAAQAQDDGSGACGFGVSGAWSDANSSGDGFNVVQVSDTASAVYYYGGDAAGNRLWLLSDVIQEQIVAGREYNLPMFLYANGDFASPTLDAENWGRLRVLFESSARATFELEGQDGTKLFIADKIAPVQGNDCSPKAAILEAYYGLDMLPPQASLLCGRNVEGLDGLPVTFSVQLDALSISPDDFRVMTADGEWVVPDCATLQPAVEALELRTVLLAGTFGTPDAQPRAVEVVGPLKTLDGNEFRGIRTDSVTRLEAGPRIVLAERFSPGAPGIAGECPQGTSQVIQMVWAGGVSGPDDADLGEPQRLGVSILLEDGSSVQPLALADDDPDNFVLACVEASSPAVAVSVAAGLFHDPGDDANPATAVSVIDRVR